MVTWQLGSLSDTGLQRGSSSGMVPEDRGDCGEGGGEVGDTAAKPDDRMIATGRATGAGGGGGSIELE